MTASNCFLLVLWESAKDPYNAAMEVISLQSGSNGNSFYVRAGDRQFLFDAGISGSQAEQRLAAHEIEIRNVDGLFVSHDHNDHSRCMGIYHRKFGIPLFVTKPTLQAVDRSRSVGELTDVHFFDAGSTLAFDDVSIHTIPTPHDSVDGVAFVVEYNEKRVGILTDLGHVFDGLRDILLSLDAVVIESNYDQDMLASGPYPERLKRRIRGPGGHLSNQDSADIICKTATFKRLKWACLCHLSEENNCPDVALEVHQQQVGRNFPIHIASRYGASERLIV